MENESLRSYWWKAPKEKVHEILFGIAKYLDQNQGYVREANLRHLRLYGNLNVLGMSSHTYAQAAPTSLTDRVTLNVIQSCCDTVTQKTAKNKPKPTFLTSGGDWTMQRKAKLLDKYVVGQFDALKVYQKGVAAFKDSTVFGTGCVKVYKAGGKICVERVFIDEIKVDQAEAMYGEPRSLYQHKLIPRELLAEMYPKNKDKILTAKRPEQTANQHDSLSTSLLVIEAWHLPSGEDAKDGRHCIVIENETLFDEVYEQDYFPFEFVHFNPRLLGFFGQGLAEILTGIQVEINKLLRVAQRLFELITPAWCIEQGSKVVAAHINNDIGRIIKYSGVKPEYYAPNAVPIQILEQIENLYRKAYEIAGVSQLGAQSKKPEGLDSGKALREFNDIESERFILMGQAYEQFYIGIAKKIITLTKECYKDDPEFGVTVKGRKFMEKIQWKEIDLSEDQYIMQVFPTSFLSTTPAARFKDVQELTQAGYIDKPNSLKLLDFPDLAGYMDLANAGLEDIESQIELMLERNEYEPPEPYQNLELGIKTMQSAYLRAKQDQVPEERLQLLRDWIDDANRLLTPPAPPPAPPAPPGMPGMPPPGMDPAMGGAPLAAPAAPPVSDLIPNAPGM